MNWTTQCRRVTTSAAPHCKPQLKRRSQNRAQPNLSGTTLSQKTVIDEQVALGIAATNQRELRANGRQNKSLHQFLQPRASRKPTAGSIVHPYQHVQHDSIHLFASPTWSQKCNDAFTKPTRQHLNHQPRLTHRCHPHIDHASTANNNNIISCRYCPAHIVISS